MKARISRIGNSRGVRIPKTLLELYGLGEGDTVDLEERREGILLRASPRETAKIPWDEAYRQMAGDQAEAAEWCEWEGTIGDGVAD